MTMHDKSAKAGMAFWKRSDSGRTQSIWVCIRELAPYESNGVRYRQWLTREIIRGGMGPMHGKSLRRSTSVNNRRFLAESEYTEEIAALISEAMAFESGNDHSPSGSYWYERRRAVEAQHIEAVKSLYGSFGLRYPAQRARKGWNYAVNTSSGNGLSLHAEFTSDSMARDFIDMAFHARLAQHATITNKSDDSVQKFRRKKSKNYSNR